MKKRTNATGGTMPNRRQFDHLVNCKFKIEIEGVTQGAFTAVDGVESSTEVIHFFDGDTPLMDRKRPGRTRYANIVLRRGYLNNDQLWQWYRKVCEGKLERKSGSIIINGDDGSEIFRYNFFEAWPCRWKSLVLDAADSKNMVEELEIAVEKVERG
jgi:phage tail-like protein